MLAIPLPQPQVRLMEGNVRSHWLGKRVPPERTLTIPHLSSAASSMGFLPMQVYSSLHLFSPCVEGEMAMHALAHACVGQKTAYRNLFSPSTMWGLGIKLRLSSLVTSSFVH